MFPRLSCLFTRLLRRCLSLDFFLDQQQKLSVSEVNIYFFSFSSTHRRPSFWGKGSKVSCSEAHLSTERPNRSHSRQDFIFLSTTNTKTKTKYNHSLYHSSSILLFCVKLTLLLMPSLFPLWCNNNSRKSAVIAWKTLSSSLTVIFFM